MNTIRDGGFGQYDRLVDRDVFEVDVGQHLDVLAYLDVFDDCNGWA